MLSPKRATLPPCQSFHAAAARSQALGSGFAYPVTISQVRDWTGGLSARLGLVVGLPLLISLAVRRAVYDEVGGLDERIAVAFNDVDLCLRIRAAGYPAERMSLN